MAAQCVVPVLSSATKLGDILLEVFTLRQKVRPDLLLIPCNSVHIASTHLIQAFGDRFVPIDEAVFSMILREGRRGRFLILGTITTVEAGFYQEGLCRLGCEAITLPADAQTMIDDFIFRDLVYGPMNHGHLHILRELESLF